MNCKENQALKEIHTQEEEKSRLIVQYIAVRSFVIYNTHLAWSK
jgi:hypothetical protein